MWLPIEMAPKDGTNLLLDSKTVPYVGSWRRGSGDEPQANEVAWRAACCGRFTDPTRWAPLPGQLNDLAEKAIEENRAALKRS